MNIKIICNNKESKIYFVYSIYCSDFSVIPTIKHKNTHKKKKSMIFVTNHVI
jgi:hypothetical protein